MALHGPFDLSFCNAGSKIQLGINGVEFEKIAMRFAGWRAGPAITNFPRVIAALARTVSRKPPVVLGRLTLPELSWGMILFTVVMVLDIYAFGHKMRNKHFLPEAFDWRGKSVLSD